MDHVCYVVVSNDEKTLNTCFKKGIGVRLEDTVIFMNQDRTPLPVFFNDYISKLDPGKNVWLVFCHQDFILNENLEPVLKALDVNSVYGVIGTRASSANLFGRILQTDNTAIGFHLTEPEPVQTFDEMCLIVHSSLFRKGLRFDCRFKFHFYVADLCMQAYTQGFGVYALQTTCQHKSKDLIGDRKSKEFNTSKELFVEKWGPYLPIRTTTGLLTNK
jgi:GT2 family glycosyltransferase